jgi:hypothetical protein
LVFSCIVCCKFGVGGVTKAECTSYNVFVMIFSGLGDWWNDGLDCTLGVSFLIVLILLMQTGKRDNAGVFDDLRLHSFERHKWWLLYARLAVASRRPLCSCSLASRMEHEHACNLIYPSLTRELLCLLSSFQASCLNMSQSPVSTLHL